MGKNQVKKKRKRIKSIVTKIVGSSNTTRRGLSVVKIVS